MDMQERAQQQLRERLTQVQNSEQVLTMELEENRTETQELREELEIVHARLSESEAKLEAPYDCQGRRDGSETTSQLYFSIEAHTGKTGQAFIIVFTVLTEHTRLVEGDGERRTEDLLRQNKKKLGEPE